MALPENLLRARERKLSGSRALNRQLGVQQSRREKLLNQSQKVSSIQENQRKNQIREIKNSLNSVQSEIQKYNSYFNDLRTLSKEELNRKYPNYKKSLSSRAQARNKVSYEGLVAKQKVLNEALSIVSNENVVLKDPIKLAEETRRKVSSAGLRAYQRKQLAPPTKKELEHIAQFKMNKKINELKSLANKGLTVGQLREKGYSMDEIGIIGSFETETNLLKQQKKLAEQDYQKFKQELPTIAKAGLTEPQLRNLYKETQLNKTPTIDADTFIKLREKTKLNEINKAVDYLLKEKPQTIQPPKNMDRNLFVKTIDVARELFPFVSKDSVKAYEKIYNGQSKNLTNAEKISVILDVTSLIGAGWLLRVGKTGVKGFKLLKKGKALTLTKQEVNAFKNIIKNETKLKAFTYLGLSIARDVKFTYRLNNSFQEAFDVDKNYLRAEAKKLGYTSDVQLYNDYWYFISKQFKDGKINLNDASNFVGLNFASEKAINKGQKEYIKYLKSIGVQDESIKKLIIQLESKRKARAYSEIFGLGKTEISSEIAAQKFLKSNLSKKTSVALAGMREGVSAVSQNYIVQGYEVEKGDWIQAILFGAVGSIYFSKQKVGDIKPKDVLKVQKKLSKDIYKILPEFKKKQWAEEYINKKSSNLTKKQIKETVKELTKTDIKKLNEGYISGVLVTVRNKYPASKKQKLWMKLKDKTNTTRDFLRGTVANVLDPAEVFGDYLAELPQKIRNKINKKLGVKATKIKRLKAKSKAGTKTKTKTKVSAKTKTKTKTKTKVSAKTKTKTKTKTKAKTKTKTKTKTKAKTKTKTKTKTKAKTKTKTKTKTKAKTKTKTKVKTIILPMLKIPLPSLSKTKKTVQAYIINLKKGNKILKSKTPLPKYRALNLLRKNLIKDPKSIGKLETKGKTNIKDIKAFRLNKELQKRIK